MKLSLVITIYNEEENIQPLLDRISESLAGHDYEVVLVDDGSTDKSIPNIREYGDEHVRLVILNRNYGQTAAMSAGIEEAHGEYIITLDGDLQNDPADIPEMIQILEERECDVVAGWRKNRKDHLPRKILSNVANGIIRKLTGVHFKDYGCTLKLFRSEYAKNLGLYGELHRFIPVLAHMQGAKIVQIPVSHHERKYGQSKYGMGRTLKVVSDLMLMVFFQKYLQKPMHLFGTVGILAFMAGFVINGYLVIEKIMGVPMAGRPLLFLGITLLLGGIQFITIGFVAELIVRTYFESQDKKIYKIRKVETIGDQSISSASRMSARAS
ncbi:MAG: glycosyltransferase family 2 protein [Cyclobacteriaceae bacterium]